MVTNTKQTNKTRSDIMCLLHGNTQHHYPFPQIKPESNQTSWSKYNIEKKQQAVYLNDKMDGML